MRRKIGCGIQLRTTGWRIVGFFSPTERAVRRQERARKSASERKALRRKTLRDEGKSSEEIEADIQADEYFESLDVDESSRFRQQQRLTLQAQGRSVPLPPLGPPYWDEGQPQTVAAYRLMTEEGLYKLKCDIRRDKEESWALRLKVATALTGLIGVSIGLISILKGCR